MTKETSHSHDGQQSFGDEEITVLVLRSFPYVRRARVCKCNNQTSSYYTLSACRCLYGHSNESAVFSPVTGFDPSATLHNIACTSFLTITSVQSLFVMIASSNCAELTMAPLKIAFVKFAPVKLHCPKFAFVKFAFTNVAFDKSAPNSVTPVKFASLKFARFSDPLVKYSPV